MSNAGNRAIEYYTIGKLSKKEVGFPKDEIWCKNCEFLYADSMNRPRCRMSGRLVFEPYNRLDDCPIEFDGTIRGNKNGS